MSRQQKGDEAMFYNVWFQSILTMLVLMVIGCFGLVVLRRTFQGVTMTINILIVVIAGIVILPVPILAIDNPTMNISARMGLCLSYAWVIFGAGFISLLACPRDAYRPKRPGVRIWTHNGITIVAAEADYQLAKKKRERLRLKDERKRRIYPDPHALLSESHPRTATISRSFYEALIKDCDVEESEMFVPGELGSSWSVRAEAIWRLVHGSDDNCPELDPHYDGMDALPPEVKQRDATQSKKSPMQRLIRLLRTRCKHCGRHRQWFSKKPCEVCSHKP